MCPAPGPKIIDKRDVFINITVKLNKFLPDFKCSRKCESENAWKNNAECQTFKKKGSNS